MPTKTFLNLPKTKQNIIIEASIKEFKRTLLKDASINKIIKDAEISRGSFYTYFDDINDLYIYSLSNYQKEIIELTKKVLIKTNGNLIEATKLINDEIIDFCFKDKELFKNVFLNFNYDISIRNQTTCENIENKYKLIELIEIIDKNNLNIKTEEEIFYIIDILINLIIHGLIEIFMERKTKEQIKIKLEKQLEILKNGIYKED